MPQIPLEEELLPYYRVEDFYPVQPGEIYNQRYQTISKLGFGGGSTVWLARDLNLSSQVVLGSVEHRPYAVLKFCTSDYMNKEAAQYQREVYKCISSANSSHKGVPYIQNMDESFEVVGPNGTQICLIFEPMRETLSFFQSRLKNERFPLDLLKMYLVCLLNGLNYLHSKCRIVHAIGQFLGELEDDSALEELVQKQSKSSKFQRRGDGYSTYRSLNQFGPLQVRLGPIVPMIADFSHAQRIDDSPPQINPIQPDYRAPEVILGTGRGSAANIWNLGTLLWGILEGSHTNSFANIHSTEGQYEA